MAREGGKGLRLSPSLLPLEIAAVLPEKDGNTRSTDERPSSV